MPSFIGSLQMISLFIENYLNDSINISNSPNEQYILLTMIQDADWRKPKSWELKEWLKRSITLISIIRHNQCAN